MARSSGPQSAGGRISIVGSSMTPAPSAPRREARASACSRARVTTMRLPNSGRRSNQSSLSRRRTTSPTMMVAGGFILPSMGGSAGRAPVVDELAGDFGKGGEAHEDHQRLGVADFGPIDCLDGVAGDEGDGGGVLAVSEGHSRVGGDAEGRGHAGDDLKGDAGIGQRLGFFTAAA